MITQPIPLPVAFVTDGQDALHSQAALLLFLGALAHREEWVGSNFDVTAEPMPWDDLGIENDYLELGIPERVRVLQEMPVQTFNLSMLMEDLQRDGIATRDWGEGTEAKPFDIGQPQYAITQRLFEKPDILELAKLAVLSIHHSAPLVRVAAASACFEVMSDALNYVGPVLVEATYSKDALVREIAATVLARVSPKHPRLIELASQGGEKGEGLPSNTSLLVHGTWARNAGWWQPSGDFHDYILTSVDSTLYAGTDRFEWSGGYSDHARALGALDLVNWVTQKGWQSPDLFTHSHGGSVTMLANRTMDIDRLVLLSCPVHKNKYWPDTSRIQKVVSVRVHMDLVILADLGGQRFRDPKIQENVLPLWFDHSTTHERNTWIQHNIPTMI